MCPGNSNAPGEIKTGGVACRALARALVSAGWRRSRPKLYGLMRLSDPAGSSSTRTDPSAALTAA